MGVGEAVAALAVTTPFALGATVAAGADAPPPWFRFQDPAIVESSGVALVDGLVVTVNDSGDEARLFVVDPDTGQTVGVTRWGSVADDIESLAPAGDDSVWVADIGDNETARATITATRVDIDTGERTAAGEDYQLAYPDGPADAEALLAHPTTGQLVVVTKSPFGGRLFVAPKALDPGQTNRLRPVGRGMAVVTGGEFFPDGRHLVLRNYGRAEVYTWPGLEAVGFVDLPSQQQGEAITVRQDGTLVITSEGSRQPVLLVRLPRAIARVVASEPTPETSPTPRSASPDPSEASTSTSREGRELPEDEPATRDPTQWLIGTGLLAVAFVVLWRALRPR